MFVDPGSGAFSTPGYGSWIWDRGKIWIRDEHQRLFSESLETVFRAKYTFKYPGAGIFLTLDLGWKNLDPGSGINIPGPQHCLQVQLKQTL